jgi:hypothetical protein
MFTTLRSRSRAWARSLGQRSRSHLEVIEKHLYRAKLLHALRVFNIIWHNCVLLWGSVACKIEVPSVMVTWVKIQIKKITRDDNITRYFPDISQSISPICISIMPTSSVKYKRCQILFHIDFDKIFSLHLMIYFIMKNKYLEWEYINSIYLVPKFLLCL